MKFRLIVVGLIYNPEGKVLICKMPEDRGVFPGQWAIVGGGVEEEEKLEEALRREVREEVGLEIGDIKPFYFRDDQRVKKYPDGTTEEQYLVYLLFECKAVTNEVKLNDEFVEFAWVLIDEALENYDLNIATRMTFEKLRSRNNGK